MGFGKDGRGQILYDKIEITLGALAADDVISNTGRSASWTEDFRIFKSEYYLNYTPADNSEGPILVGIADGALSAAEIEEALESSPAEANDAPAIEFAQRAVWPLEIFNISGFAGTAEVSNEGFLTAKGEKNLRWTFSDQDGYVAWALNLSDSVLTTGGKVFMFLKNFGMWVV